MVKRVSIVGHNTTQANDFIGNVREVTVDTSRNELRVHDGATPGGHRILNSAQIAQLYFSLSSTELAIDTIVEKTPAHGVDIEGVHFEDAHLEATNITVVEINGEDFDDFVDEVDDHIADVANPHSVTKTQVGLANVTNDAQVKIASNLSDVANAPTSFNNIKQAASDTYAGVAERVVLSELDALDNSRFIPGDILGALFKQGANIASDTNIAKPADANRGGRYHVTGTTETETLWSTTDFPWPQMFIADGNWPLKHSANLILPNAENLTLKAGQAIIAVPEASDVWRVFVFDRAPGLVGKEFITASGNYTKKPWQKFIIVYCMGSGAGAGNAKGAGSTTAVGGSGAAGGTAIKLILVSALSNTTTVTIGAKGLGAAASTTVAQGQDGNTTSFGAHCSATGGEGGPGYQGYTGGGDPVPDPCTMLGGIGIGGDINLRGNPGQFVSQFGEQYGTQGGSSVGPYGGSGAAPVVTTSRPVAGNNADGYGGGGSGGCTLYNNASSIAKGGDGAPGLVVVEEYA